MARAAPIRTFFQLPGTHKLLYPGAHVFYRSRKEDGELTEPRYASLRVIYDLVNTITLVGLEWSASGLESTWVPVKDLVLRLVEGAAWRPEEISEAKFLLDSGVPFHHVSFLLLEFGVGKLKESSLARQQMIEDLIMGSEAAAEQ